MNDYELNRRDLINAYPEIDEEEIDNYFANPDQLLNELNFDYRIDQTIPKEVEAGITDERPLSRNVTFDEINSEGYRSNFRRSRNFNNARSSGRFSSFRSDRAPKGAIQQLLGQEARIEDYFFADFAGQKTGSRT